MASYKGFTLNAPGDSKPWGAREYQAWKDDIDTLVKDCVLASADTINGHRHYALWDTNGNNRAVEVDAAGNVSILHGDVAMGGNNITGLADPVNAQDAATRAYTLSVAGVANTLDDVCDRDPVTDQLIQANGFNANGYDINGIGNLSSTNASIGVENDLDFNDNDLNNVNNINTDQVTIDGAGILSQDYIIKSTDSHNMFRGQRGGVGAAFAFSSNDADGTDNTRIYIYGKGYGTNGEDAYALSLGWDVSEDRFAISELIEGTGTYKDLNIVAGVDTTEQLLLYTDGGIGMFGDLDMNSHKITEVTDPTAAQDAATKNYVDGLTGSNTNATLDDVCDNASTTDQLIQANGFNANGHDIDGIGNLSSTNASIGVEDDLDIQSNKITNGGTGGLELGGDGYGLLERVLSETNSAKNVFILRHTTDQDMVDDFGTTLAFSIKDVASSSYISNISAVRDGADAQGKLQLKVNNPAETGIDIDHNLNVGIYGDTNHNGHDIDGIGNLSSTGGAIGVENNFDMNNNEIHKAKYYSNDDNAGISQTYSSVANFDISIENGIITSFTKNS